MSEKARMVIVTDPLEVDAVRRENETGALGLPRGGFLADGTCVAYSSDLQRWRERRAAGTATEGRSDV